MKDLLTSDNGKQNLERLERENTLKACKPHPALCSHSSTPTTPLSSSSPFLGLSSSWSLSLFPTTTFFINLSSSLDSQIKWELLFFLSLSAPHEQIWTTQITNVAAADFPHLQTQIRILFDCTLS